MNINLFSSRYLRLRVRSFSSLQNNNALAFKLNRYVGVW